MMKRKLRVFKEDVKARHTAHWDWDYISWEEIERRLKEAGVEEETRIAQNKRSLRERCPRSVLWIGLGLLILAGLSLVVMAATVFVKRLT
jgi:hypothetical protein